MAAAAATASAGGGDDARPFLDRAAYDRMTAGQFSKADPKAEWAPASVRAILDSRVRTPWNASRLAVAALRTKESLKPLKLVLRNGVGDLQRGDVWSQVLCLRDLPDSERNYDAGVVRAFGTARLSNPTIPLFGGVACHSHALTADGTKVANLLMCVLVNDFPQLTYCPLLMPTATLLLHQLDANSSLGCLTLMLRSSLHAHEWRYFLCSPRESWLFTEVVFDLIESSLPALYRHAIKLAGDRPSWSEFWRPLLNDLFRGQLPLAAQMRLMDSFVLEGLKVLARLALGVLAANQATFMQAPTIQTLNNAILGRLAACEGAPFEAVWKHGFRLQLARADLAALRDRNQKLIHSAAARISHDELYVRQMPEVSTASALLPDDVLHALWKWVPLRYRQRDLDLIFDTAADGYSLRTLYERAGARAPVLLVARSTAGRTLGAFVTVPFSTRPKAAQYYGDGEVFVFALQPTLAFYPWAKMDRAAMVAARAHGSGGAVIYRSEEAGSAGGAGAPAPAPVNDYFILATPQALSFGGGSTGPALSFDDMLNVGRTGPCETFASEGLHGDDTNFTVAAVELYALV